MCVCELQSVIVGTTGLDCDGNEAFDTTDTEFRLRMRLAVFYGAALALLAAGLRELLTGSEENRCSMTYMYEYPEYRVRTGGYGLYIERGYNQWPLKALYCLPSTVHAHVHTPTPSQPSGDSRCLEHRDTRLGGAGDRTSNLQVNSLYLLSNKLPLVIGLLRDDRFRVRPKDWLVSSDLI